VAASLAGGAGVEAAELAIRAGLTRLGRGVLEGLLGADGGHRGPRVDCGSGHLAEFESYRGPHPRGQAVLLLHPDHHR
jgi:hypothetical protein